MSYTDPNYDHNILIRLICTLWEKDVITEKEEIFIVTGEIKDDEKE